MIKTAIGTSTANAAKTTTITSPNTKTIKIFSYLVTYKGADFNASDITIDIKDEDDNVLWSDCITQGAATAADFRASFNFGNRPLYLQPGKNAKVVVSAGGANVLTITSVQYDL